MEYYHVVKIKMKKNIEVFLRTKLTFHNLLSTFLTLYNQTGF